MLFFPVFAFLHFTDTSGNYEVTCFSETLTKFREQLVVGNSFIVHASVSFDDNAPRITVNSLEPLEKAAAAIDLSLKIWIDQPRPIEALREILDRQGQGRGIIIIVFKIPEHGEIEVDLGEKFKVSPELLLAIKTIPGVIDAREVQ